MFQYFSRNTLQEIFQVVQVFQEIPCKTSHKTAMELFRFKLELKYSIKT